MQQFDGHGAHPAGRVGRARRMAPRLLALAVLVASALLARAEPGRPPVYELRQPLKDKHFTTRECLVQREGTNEGGDYVLLLNRCDRVVYVAIQEWMTAFPDRQCAVFGLSGRGYGKLYRGVEHADTGTLRFGRNQDEIIDHCLRSGYDITGGGIGTFFRTVDDSVARERAANLARDELARCEAEQAGLDLVLNEIVKLRAALAVRREPIERLRKQLGDMSRRMLADAEGAKFTAMADRFDELAAAYTAQQAEVDQRTRAYNDTVNTFNSSCAGFLNMARAPSAEPDPAEPGEQDE